MGIKTSNKNNIFVLKCFFQGCFRIIQCIIEKYSFLVAHYILSDQSLKKTTVKKLENFGCKEL